MAASSGPRALRAHLNRTMTIATHTTPMCSNTARPHAASFPRPAIQKRPQRAHKHASPLSIREENFNKDAPAPSNMPTLNELSARTLPFRQPNTFVSPPLYKNLSRPLDWLRLTWLRLYQHGRDWVGLYMFALSRKDVIWSLSRSPFRVNRRALTPIAKGLHATMNDAIARGDHAAVQAVCVKTLGNDLAGKVQLLRQKQENKYPGLKVLLAALTRQQRQAGWGGKEATAPLFRWELVKYTKPWAYPRLVDHKVAMMPLMPGKLTPVRQAVVAIASRQRLTDLKPVEVEDERVKMVEVEGSVREVDLVEYVTMVALVDPEHQTGEWLIMGTEKETTLETWDKERNMFDALEGAHRSSKRQAA